VSASGRLAVVVVCAAIVAMGEVALACPVCFRVEDETVITGVYSAVFVLFGVTTVVLSGVAVFMVGFLRRARRHELREAGHRR
jgi:hypothetical protein